MDPRQLFSDCRNTGICVYCGGTPTTRDHVPSRVFLDEPFPADLPVVPACAACNVGFSLDEQYVACFIECVLAGSTEPGRVTREKVARMLESNARLSSRILHSRVERAGAVLWRPESERIVNVALKLARGHAAYWLSEPRLDGPSHTAVLPLGQLALQERTEFEATPVEHLFPEIGSRAFREVVIVDDEAEAPASGWTIVQPDRYRYLVSYSERIVVRVVLREYLACEVAW